MKPSPEATAAATNLIAAAQTLAAKHDSDILIYNGPIRRPFDDTLIDLIWSRRRRKNALLILTTYGGDPNAAYRIARALQESYAKVTVFVLGYCTSAGTLIAVGAHELVLSRHSQLGPLDIQMAHRDEVGERLSGLTPSDALHVLDDQARYAFEESFNHMRYTVGLSTQTAGQLAAEMVGGLYGRIYAQVDPLRLGECDRANRVALRYGERLAGVSGNLKDDALTKLVVGVYPSHDFVIDRTEARELFNVVRDPTSEEAAVAQDIDRAMRAPISHTMAQVTILNAQPPDPGADHAAQHNGTSAEGSSGADQGDAASGGSSPQVAARDGDSTSATGSPDAQGASADRSTADAVMGAAGKTG